MKDFTVPTGSRSHLENRNGIVDISDVEVWGDTAGEVVYINGVSRAKQTTVRGGFCLDADSFYALCRKGMAENGLFMVAIEDFGETTYAIGWSPEQAVREAVKLYIDKMSGDEKDMIKNAPEEALDHYLSLNGATWHMISLDMPEPL